MAEDKTTGKWSEYTSTGDGLSVVLNLKVARDVPGIDAAYLAMDTENGVEVVWNEVCYSNRRASRGSHGKVRDTIKASVYCASGVFVV